MAKNKTGRKSLDVVNDDPRVTEVFSEGEDGYWLYLNPGWTCDPRGAHDGHEDTVKRLLDVYRAIEPCECADCKDRAPADAPKGGC